MLQLFKKNCLNSLLFTFVLSCFISCTGHETSLTATDHLYKIEHYFPDAAERDTLLANMITYIYRKPRLATNEKRTHPEFRQYYVNNITRFTFDSYFISDDSVHYYFLIRPARTPEGYTRRGTGGKFKLGENFELLEFEETFNTPAIPEEDIIFKGRQVFSEMINGKNTGKFTANKEFIEWPDERLKYDKEMKEWRYMLE